MTTIHHGDCIQVMNAMPPESVDAIVTDPPYGISFMSAKWDAIPPGVQWAEACYRVLKPGGHIVAFGGTRTWHRLAVAIEDAGFEMRDSLAWLYGSGFSKSWNFGTRFDGKWCSCGENAIPYSHADSTDLPRMRNAIHAPPVEGEAGEDADLLPAVQREVAGRGMGEAWEQGSGGMETRVGTRAPGTDDRCHESGMEGRQLHRAGQGLSDDPAAGASKGPRKRLCGGAPARDGGDDRPSGHAAGGSASHQPGSRGQQAGEPETVRGPHGPLDDGALRGRPVCAKCGGLDAAYRGAGTALKPAFEPIVLARKPFPGTVAKNVLEHGTGAINVDACRIAGEVPSVPQPDFKHVNGAVTRLDAHARNGQMSSAPSGRWPANVVLDQHAAAWVDEQSGHQKDGVAVNRNKNPDIEKPHTVYGGGWMNGDRPDITYGGGGGASRFFYTAKAPKRERPNVDGVQHPTVKPLAIMQWLIRLVTPPGGTVLDPFAGSGTTIEAALIEGFNPVGIEMETDYLPLIQHRIDRQAGTLTA